MKIVLATPLYPPDIAPPAPYIKELAKRLSSGHKVTIVTYGRLPEKVPGVEIVSVAKNQVLAVRLVRYLYALWHATRGVDILYIQNGASVELPALLISFFTSVPMIMGFGDSAAHERLTTHPMVAILERMTRAQADILVHEIPPARPIIFPLQPKPEEELLAYEITWRDHVSKLERLMTTI